MHRHGGARAWLGCSTTLFTAPRLSYSLWKPGARKSQIFTVPSSLPLYIQRPSRSNPTAVTLPVWPSKVVTGCGLLVFTSYNRMAGLPAAARYCLSGLISSLFTCESAYCSVR